MARLRPITATTTALALATGAGFAIAQDETAESVSEPESVTESLRQMPMGQVCWAAILEAVSEIGKRCVDNEDADIRRELDRSNAALGELLLKAGWSESDLAGFRAQMGNRDVATEMLCSNKDGVEFYNSLIEPGAEQIAKTTEAMLKRPGPPEWGTCL